MKIAILDPASTEFNRGSFCYLPYIAYSALKEQGHEVSLFEDFTCARIDSLQGYDAYLVALWSYPQIDAARTLNRFLPIEPSFFGYYPLIDQLGFSKWRIPDLIIEQGIKSYWKYFKDFTHILLSDCDMHLTKYEGTVYPLFTSYGCPNKCKFCPVSPNCDAKRIALDENSVCAILNNFLLKGYTNIHLTDEDFFFDIDRAYEILSYADGLFNFIALGSVHSVLSFIDKYGIDFLKEKGMKLIEVGLESASNDLNKDMGKGGMKRFEKLAELTRGKVDIFWLTMTFYPGETLKSLRETGEFLKKYGFQLEELYGRIQTNSTEGGLGQFFQLYVGAGFSNEPLEYGIELPGSPVRLLPSLIPESLLNCKVTEWRAEREDEKKWYRLYRLPERIFSNHTVHFSEKEDLDVLTIFEDLVCNHNYTHEQAAIYIAISARLGVIS